MDSKILIQLYQDIIRSYPFSITGRPNSEKALADFFARFCRHSIIKERENILFVIALFAELTSLRLDKTTLEQVISWQTKPLRNLLLFNYEGEYPDLILSFYLTLLHHVSGGKDITATNIIASNVIGDVDLRIKVTQFHQPSIHFIEREDVIEFRTPRRIFRKEFWDEQKGCLRTGEVRRILQNYLPDADLDTQLIARATSENPHVFVIDRGKVNAFERSDDAGQASYPVMYEIFDRDALKETIDSYFDEFRRLSKRVLAGKIRDSEQNTELTWIAIGGAFLAAYYDINLDYVLSVCNVSSNEFNTLGGLAVGSKRNAPLSLAERALFSMISDHVSANLSAQMVHDLFAVQFMKGRAKHVLKKFAKNSAFKTLTHTNQPGENTKELAERALVAFNREKVGKILSSDTTKLIKNYLFRLKQPGIVGDDYKLVRSGYERVKTGIEFSARDIWSYLSRKGDKYRSDGIEFILSPDGNTLSTARLYGDHYWIQNVLDTALGNSSRESDRAFDPGRFNGKAEIKAEIFFLDEGNNKSPTPPTEGPSTLYCVIEDNGIGCDVYEIPSRGGGYGPFFVSNSGGLKSYSHVLNAHGNILIESRGRKLSFLEPKIKSPSQFNADGTKVTLMLECVIE